MATAPESVDFIAFTTRLRRTARCGVVAVSPAGQAGNQPRCETLSIAKVHGMITPHELFH